MKKSAFTLIELSIVLVIIGLLIGGSFKILKVMRERAQISRAQDDVKTAKEAITGYVQTTYKLPTSTVFDNTLSPVKNNQHPLFYTYGRAAVSNSDNICSFIHTDLKVVTAEGNDINDIAFVVASEAANHNMQTGLTDNVDGTYSVKTYNYATKVDDNTSPVNIVENYDDVVDWVTLKQLQEEAGCARKPLAFINTTLPIANVGESYSATLYVENNVTSVSISCDNNNDKNISFSDPSFSGTPDAPGTSQRVCTATEDGTDRNVTKTYVITVNPIAGGNNGNNGNGGNNGNNGNGGNGGNGWPFP